MNKNVKILILTLSMLMFLGLDCKKKMPIEPPHNNKPDTTSHNFVWSIDTVGTFQSQLWGVWGSSPNNVYAVGLVYWPGKIVPINIVHWNGIQWDSINYSEGELEAIFGFNANDIWAVGYWRVDNNLYPLITHWNGTQWQTWKLQGYSYLKSICGTSSSNLYAVGGVGTILFYNGNSWSSVSNQTQLGLLDIGVIYPDHFYVVGGSESTNTGVMLKNDKNAWKKIFERSYILDSMSGLVSSVSGYSSNNVIVSTGAEVYLGRDSNYKRIDVPTDNTFIEQIRGSDSSNIFMCGSYGIIIHWNGKSWKRYDDFYRKPEGDFLTGVWTARKNVFVVGQSEDYRGIVYRGKN